MPIGTRVFKARVTLPPTRYSSADPQLPWNVTVEVDVDTLMKWMGEKARRNKSKRSREADGCIVVKVSPG